jgi:hypothetical protein
MDTRLTTTAMITVGVVVITLGCDGFWRQRAACEQAVVAYCAMSEHCGGEAAGSCESARSSLVTSCSFSVEDSTVCVEAANALLADDCAAVPTDIACPAEVVTAPSGEGEGEGQRDTTYRVCTNSNECDAPLECAAPDNRTTAFCLVACAEASTCPAPTNGFDAQCLPLTGLGNTCVAGCQADTDCAEGLVCADGTNCFPAQ